MTMATTAPTTQVHRVWIKATPEAIWDAITKPEWVDRYGYGGLPEYGPLEPGTAYVINAGTGMQEHGVSGAIIDGELLEVDPPRRLVQTWRMLMDPTAAAEPASRMTYDIKALEGGVTRLTVTVELDGAPATASILAGELEDSGQGGGGMAWSLSDLKSLLETGTPMAA